METLELKKDKPIWKLDTIENDFQRLYDHYRDVYNQNAYLRKENERIKSEAYKDEELSRMKEMYDGMRADYFRGFPISEKEEEKIHEWMDSLPEAASGAIGGRFSYSFTPPGIGVVGTVTDLITGQKFTFQGLS